MNERAQRELTYAEVTRVARGRMRCGHGIVRGTELRRDVEQSRKRHRELATASIGAIGQTVHLTSGKACWTGSPDRESHPLNRRRLPVRQQDFVASSGAEIVALPDGGKFVVVPCGRQDSDRNGAAGGALADLVKDALGDEDFEHSRRQAPPGRD